MHSKIYEIRHNPFENNEWASECEIGDEYGNIEGVDYYDILYDPARRCETIKSFFEKWFPDNSFKVLENEPNKTAVVEFVGDINALYDKWREQIQKAAQDLSERMDGIWVYRVRMALDGPFGLSSKFYQPEWNGCTVCADDFLGYLIYLDEQNDGKPFKLYVGQVFDYHF